MLEKLWNDIRFIYDGLNFSSKELIDDLMIIPQDNCYLLYYKSNSDISTQIRIEKNYDLVRMWSDDNEVNIIQFVDDIDMTNYKIYVELGGNVPGGKQIIALENSMIEISYKVITPFLREVKLKEIGI